MDAGKWVRRWNECRGILNSVRPDLIYTCHFGEMVAQLFFYQRENDFFTRPVEHLLCKEKFDLHNFSIYIIDQSDTQVPLPLAFLSEYEQTLGWHFEASEDNDYLFYFSKEAEYASFQLINKNTKEAIFWCSHQKSLPLEYVFPFWQILSAFFENTSYCLLYAAGVALYENGILMVAKKGGCGKSTAAFACIQAEWKQIGDDVILIDSQNLYMYSVSNGVLLREGDAELFNRLEIKSGDSIGDRKQGFLYPKHGDKIQNKVKIKAIVMVQYDPLASLNTLIPSSPSKALLTLLPSGLFTALKAMPSSSAFLKQGGVVLRHLSHLSKSLPAYELISCSDVGAIPSLLETMVRAHKDNV